jgi:hypothetical protein
MQSDTELTQSVIDYMTQIPYATAYDVVQHFRSLGVSSEKVLYILRELIN